MSLFSVNEISELSAITWARHQELEKAKLEKNIVPLLHCILDSIDTEKVKADLKDRCQDYTHVKDLRVSLCLLDLDFNGIPVRKILKKTTVLNRVANVLYPGHFEVKAHYNEKSVYLEANYFPKLYLTHETVLPCLCDEGGGDSPTCFLCGSYTPHVVNPEDTDHASMPGLEMPQSYASQCDLCELRAKKRRYSHSSE